MPKRPAARRDTLSLSAAPRPAVHVDGVLHDALTNDLIALSIEHSVSTPAVCTARYANVRATPDGRREYAYFGLNDVDFGRRFTVWLGVPPDVLVSLFDGRINLLEGQFDASSEPTLVIQAEDALQMLRMRSRTRVFQDATDVEIMQSIAADHGLSSSIELNAPSVTHARVAQFNQSDLAFLLDRAVAIGAMVWIEQETLVVRDSEANGGPGSLAFGENLLSFTARADVRQQSTVFGVAGWDVTSKQPIAQSAGEADLPPNGVDGRSGGQVLSDAFGARLETVIDMVPASSSEADALAVAAHRENSAEFVTGTGVAVNVPTLRVGHAVVVQGVGALFTGRYQVVAVRHLFDSEQGFRTEFDVRRPRLARPRMHTKSSEVKDAGRDQ